MSVHGEAKPFVCPTCRKEFATWIDIRAHQKREQAAPQVKCDVRGHATRTTKEMREHLNTHSDERSGVCNECGLRYKHKASLRRHVFAKHRKWKLCTCINHLRVYYCSQCKLWWLKWMQISIEKNCLRLISCLWFWLIYLWLLLISCLRILQ